jgi:hypothetical protein
MKKQTAVEWLLLNLSIAGVSSSEGLNIDEVRAKAKQMEKEQIEQSFVACWKANVPYGIECKLSANEYYNKTYKDDTIQR